MGTARINILNIDCHSYFQIDIIFVIYVGFNQIRIRINSKFEHTARHVNHIHVFVITNAFKNVNISIRSRDLRYRFK